MNKSPKKFRVVGERRAELDVARFADALITFALHRRNEHRPTVEQLAAPVEGDQETS